MSDARDAQFTRHKSRHAMTWAHLALLRCAEMPCITSIGRPWEGLTVYVVGAGPSLDTSGPLLRRLPKGARVMATNSSDVALRAHGVTADVIVVRECIDMSEDVAASGAPVVALDIAAHPAAWQAAGERGAFFIPMYPRQIELARMMGVDVVPGGTAALTSAVRLALMWGAAEVVLVGADLAFRPDGQTYAGAAPRGAQTYATEGDVLVLTGNDKDDARCEASGQRPPPKRIAYERVTALDWSQELVTINVWSDQREWLEETARREPSVRFVNATEGGVGIAGWRAVPLRELLRGLRDRGAREPVGLDTSAGRVDPHRVREAVEQLRRDAAHAEVAAREMLARTGPDFGTFVRLDGWHRGSAFSDALGAWQLVDLDPSEDPVTRCEAVYRALRDSAVASQDLLMGRMPVVVQSVEEA